MNAKQMTPGTPALRPARLRALLLTASLLLGLLGLASACSGDGQKVTGGEQDVCRSGDPSARLQPAGGAVYFGVNLDWEHDSAIGFSQRLGRNPALYVAFAPFPIDAGASDFIDATVQQVAGQQGMLMLTLEPHGGLGTINERTAAELANRLAAYNASGVPVFLRFAHEMNGSWYAWSQQPQAYVQAFRLVAEAVHENAPKTAMVWAPNYGGGYPFAGGKYEAAPGSVELEALDTNHDGMLTMGDDSYGPYYPGDDAVDWVGMSLYHWGSAYPWGENELPEPGKFIAQLTGNYSGSNGDERSLPDFYDVYAQQHEKPLAITETAAFFAPAAGGAAGATIKQRWWEQVFSAEVHKRFPALAMINWFEWSKYESEVGAQVDWTVTRDHSTAMGFSSSLPEYLRFAGEAEPCN